MRKRIALFAAAVVASVLVGGIAWASIPAADGTINGCRKNTDGSLRVIDSSATCPSGYTALNWSQTGPQGSPGVSGSVLVSNAQGFSVTPGQAFQLSASCPAGEVVLGGGGDSDRDLAVLRGSGPTNPSPPAMASGWTVRFKFIGAASDTVTVDAWAICASVA